MTAGQTESEAWVIPQLLTDTLCQPDTIRTRQTPSVITGKRRANTAITPLPCVH